jgi:hypothetical protein
VWGYNFSGLPKVGSLLHCCVSAQPLLSYGTTQKLTVHKSTSVSGSCRKLGEIKAQSTWSKALDWCTEAKQPQSQSYLPLTSYLQLAQALKMRLSRTSQKNWNVADFWLVRQPKVSICELFSSRKQLTKGCYITGVRLIKSNTNSQKPFFKI